MQQIQPQEQQWPQDKQLYQMQNWKKKEGTLQFLKLTWTVYTLSDVNNQQTELLFTSHNGICQRSYFL